MKLAENYLVTGYRGATPHVTAEDDRCIHEGLFGPDAYVLPVGSNLAASLTGSNTVRLLDGALCDQGAVAVIPSGQYVDLTIENGTQGMKRNDLIVFRYSKSSLTQIESGEFVVLQGAPGSSAADPALTSGTIADGETDEMPLYRIQLDGVSVGTPEPLYTRARSIMDGVPPKFHASDDTTYGKGTSGNYGHVKLSDAISSTSSTSNGTAATPKAVKAAYDLAAAALPKSGGTMTGNVSMGYHTVTDVTAIYLKQSSSRAHSQIIQSGGDQQMVFRADSSTANYDLYYGVYPGNSSVNDWFVMPQPHNAIYCGGAYHGWAGCYAAAYNSTSDAKRKQEVETLGEDAVALVMRLRPVSYQWVQEGAVGTGQRRHMGLLAQEVAQAAQATMGDLSVYEADCVDESGAPCAYDAAIPDERKSWTLKYQELIAPLIAVVQQQQRAIEALTARLEAVEGGAGNGV